MRRAFGLCGEANNVGTLAGLSVRCVSSVGWGRRQIKAFKRGFHFQERHMGAALMILMQVVCQATDILAGFIDEVTC